MLAILLMLAFSFQSNLAQTHIHNPAVAASAVSVHQPAHGKAPQDNAPFDCPFCQAVSHAGSILLADAALPLLTTQWVRAATPRLLLTYVDTLANHHWRSRAPPSP